MAREDSTSNSASKSPYLIKLVLLGLAVLLAVVLLWQMAGDDTPEPAPVTIEEEAMPEPEPALPSAPAPEIVEAEPVPEPAPEPEPEPLPELAESDAAALAVAEELSPTEDLRELVVDDNLISKSVRAIIGLAGGNVVNEYRPVQPPNSPLVVEKLDEPPSEEQGQLYRLSTENYQRYDKYVDVVSTLNPQKVASVYRRFYPLLEEAYAQNGVDRGSFKDITLNAIDSMLAAPVLEEEPILIRPKVLYQFQDPLLEALPGPQKLLIRMGPENTRQVQAVLREIREAIAGIDVPEQE